MTLADLLKRTFWAEIASVLRRDYAELSGDPEPIKKVFQALLELKPTPSCLRIHLRDSGEGGAPEVVGREAAADSCDYALEYQPWDEWLGMELADEALAAFGPAQVAAHCLFELTLLGYSEAEVIAERQALLSRIRQLGEPTAQHIAPLTKALKDAQRDV